MKRLLACVLLVVFIVNMSLLMGILLFGGLRPFDADIPNPTPYKSGHVQPNGLFQGWYHVGNCIYIEQDTGCDIDG